MSDDAYDQEGDYIPQEEEYVSKEQQQEPLDVEETEKLDIVSEFIVDSPPGEVNDVFNDVRVLLNDDDLLRRALVQRRIVDAFEQHNTEQFVNVNVPGKDYEVIISKYGQTEDGRYVDPRSSQVFLFDHLQGKISDLEPPERFEPNQETEVYRSALDDAARKYVSEHYPDGVVSVFDLADKSFAICIVDNKYNAKNFWNGRWRSWWIVRTGSNKIQGSIRIQVHYYEDGNVQLNNTHDLTATLLSTPSDPAAFATSVFKAILKSENDLQIGLNESFATLSDTTFKSLRRALPVTRNKIDWFSISNYKIGSEISQK